jgi:hypothetical protein
MLIDLRILSSWIEGDWWSADLCDDLASADRTLQLLQKLGKKLIFVTNTSTKTRAQYVAKVVKLGISLELVSLVVNERAHPQSPHLHRIKCTLLHTPQHFDSKNSRM